jgi:multidrug transporter EmrE-like cation transporter
LTKKEADLIKTYVVLFIGLCFEAFGNVLLRKGMKEVGEVTSFSIPALFDVFVKGATNLTVITGVALDALFFACLLIALSWTEVTVVLPITAFGYVMQAFVAKVLLHEDMSVMRWAGTLAIVLGCILVGKSGMH